MDKVIGELLAGNPWPFFFWTIPMVVAFLGYVFRQSIDELLFGPMRDRRQRKRRREEMRRLFSDGEREVLLAAGMKGELIFSRLDDSLHHTIRVGSGSNAVILKNATFEDLCNLRNRYLLEDLLKNRYRLTPKGQEQSDQLSILFPEEMLGENEDETIRGNQSFCQCQEPIWFGRYGGVGRDFLLDLSLPGLGFAMRVGRVRRINLCVCSVS